MNTLAKITLTETKLALRTPGFVLGGLLLPTAITAVLGAIPAIRADSGTATGMRFLDAWVPSMIVLTMAMMGLQAIPGIIASYREQGILRRFATTPVHPAQLLVAQLIINVTVTIGGVGILLVTAGVVFDVPSPRHPLGFLLTFVLGTIAIFGLGLIAAAVAKTSRAAAWDRDDRLRPGHVPRRRVAAAPAAAGGHPRHRRVHPAGRQSP